MLTAIIVDDELESRKTLHNFLKMFCPNVVVLAQAADVVPGIKAIKQHQPDVVFLDIQMPGGTGFDLLELIQSINFEVIFTTAFDEYAIKAFKYSAIDYLLKPIDPDELIAAVDKLTAAQTALPDSTHNFIQQRIDVLFANYTQANGFQKLSLPTTDGIDFVNIGDIVRCESERNYTLFYMQSGERMLVTKNIKEYEKMFATSHFFRVHKSHLVNLNFMKKYVKGEGGYLIMQDGSEIEVARRRKAAFLEKLAFA